MPGLTNYATTRVAEGGVLSIGLRLFDPNPAIRDELGLHECPLSVIHQVDEIGDQGILGHAVY